MAEKQKLFVRRPSRRFGGWVVVVADGIGPLANEKEVLTFSSRESAYQCYRHIRKEMGKGL